MTDKLILGADIGGSHITTGVIGLSSNSLANDSFYRLSIDSHADADAILDIWTKAIKIQLDKWPSIQKVALAMPGPFDYENGISLIRDQGKYLSLYGINVKQKLAQGLALDPANIVFVNDAVSFLAGEIYAGKAKTDESTIALTLGTGLGAAVHENGQTRDIALWQEPFRGFSAEHFFSTRWFIERYSQKTGRKIAHVKALLEVADQEVCVAIFDEFADNLCEFLTGWIGDSKFDALVLGGNISQSSNLFLPKLIQGLGHNGIHLDNWVSELGEVALLFGAVYDGFISRASWSFTNKNKL
ncbi:ROK family protein [Belliella marina]|uniref:ROK family protein n=1 Tax=Belliella marina TaxID=1644146 RepID=A0ABW4VRK3_9BACT